jgi:hypothetical protein
MNRLFVPSGAQEFEHTVRLSNGVVLPKWAFAAVGIEGDSRPASPGQSGNPGVRGRLWMDVESGVLSDAPGRAGRRTPGRSTGPRAQTAPEHGYDDFSRVVDIGRVIADYEASRPRLQPFSQDREVNPGYFSQTSSGPRDATQVSVSASAQLSRNFILSENYVLGDLLVCDFKRQDLVEQQGQSTRMIAENLKWLAVNVLERFNDPNPNLATLQESGNLGYSDAPVSFSVHTGLANDSSASPVAECRRGTAVRVVPSGTSVQVYLKAIDLAAKIEFDEVRLDYYTDGATTITVIGSQVASRRRLNTYYDDQLVHPNRLVHVVKDRDSYLVTQAPRQQETDADVHYSTLDDYSTLEALLNDMSLFSSLDDALELARSLGFGTNPFLSGRAGQTPDAGTVVNVGREALSRISSAIKCPQQRRSQSLFPIASHPAMRTLTDATQLDDTRTQDATPYTMRTNNPLGVPVVKGVTDLKTRFGFLGESEGKAVYRDHVGGAAAGLAYLSQQGGGKTLKGALGGVLGDKLGALSKAAEGAGDLTRVSAAASFAGMSKDLFGKTDPTGTLLGCATLDVGDMDQLIHTAASMAKNLSGNQTEQNPLTYDEWASAYQISKNEPNGHLKKTTTGVDLPAQEQEEPQDTGPRTDRQGKETGHTADPKKRGEKEQWNPLSNYKHFSETLWKKWIDAGLVKYEQKQSEEDKDKIAKKDETEELSQVAENPTTMTLLDWTART